MKTVLDLFSGIGGFSLGLESTGLFRTVAFCEIEEFPRKVLRKHWPDIPIHEDIHDISGYMYRGVDVITGGFPCQPISIAGKGKGKEDPRWLWPEMFRVIREARPRWCIIENSPRLRTLHGDDVLGDLEESGYTCWPLVVGAGAAGAPHKRKRIWVVAHAQGGRWQDERQRRCSQESGIGSDGTQGMVAHTDSPGLAQYPGQRGNPCQEQPTFIGGHRLAGNTNGSGREWQRLPIQPGQQKQAGDDAGRSSRRCPDPSEWSWERAPEPVLRRVDDGLPCGVDRRQRIVALGNAVVPQIVAKLGKAIIWVEMIEL